VVLADGNEIDVKAGEDGARFLLVSGEPIGEPVAWRGPIVMNTEQELDIAFQEYWSGRFIKSAAKQ
jgi:redox-sensitive bicupin YhaK (pirin superfamily)